MENFLKNKDKTIAHACLMIFVWLFLIPSGIIIARYHKNLLPSLRNFNVPFWFNMHRLIMIISLFLTIPAFILILAQNNWHWVSADNRTKYTHSILGIVTFGLLLFQITFGSIIPGKNSLYRSFFVWFHRFSGIFTLILSITVCYFGVMIEGLNLENVGWGLILGHNLWTIIFIIFFEITNLNSSKKSYFKTNSQDNEEPKKDFNANNIMLVVHLVGSLVFVLALIIMISIRMKAKLLKI